MDAPKGVPTASKYENPEGRLGEKSVEVEDQVPVGEAHEPLERYITLNPIVAFGLTLQSAWEAIAISFQAAFLNGGPISLVYGIIIVTVGSTALAATLGEMAAVDPAVGAQYRWAARYAPQKLRPQFWGFMQGWLTLIAWVASCALTPFSLGTVVQAIIQFNDLNYDPKRWHATLLMIAFILPALAWNLFARRVFVPLELGGGLLHILLFIAVVAVLGALGPHNSSDFVWNTSVSGVSGWTNSGVTFCIGLISPAFAVGGFDGVIHMSDETKEAHRHIPRAMVLTVLINGTIAFGFIICLLYTMGDPQVVLDPTLSSLPIITILHQATGSVSATNAIMSLFVVVLVIGDFSIFASVSRLAWAFARDGGLPFPEFFGHVNTRLKIPLNALGLVAVLCALLAVINIGSTVAFYAVISLATFSLFISYITPVVFLLLLKLRGESIQQGPWRLGRFGIPINIFALCYAVFMATWLPFPTSIPVNKDTMNYAAPVWGGVMILAVLDYVTTGHRRFRVKV